MAGGAWLNFCASLAQISERLSIVRFDLPILKHTGLGKGFVHLLAAHQANARTGSGRVQTVDFRL